ncbi:MAG: RHS repeat-associated core domain-containing protein [Candidatus Acidiferrales bacterium]
MTNTRRLLSTAILGLAFLGFASAAQAQYPGYLTNSNDTGLPDYGSFISSKIDSVNLANGGLIIRIPLLTTKDRNATVATGFQYDSKFWAVNRSYYPYPQMPQNTAVYSWGPNNSSFQSGTGWHGYSDGTGAATFDWTENIWTCSQYYNGQLYEPATTKVIRGNFVVIDETGAKHQVPDRAIYTTYQYVNYCPDDWNQSPMNAVAESDSGNWQLDITNLTYQTHAGAVITSMNGVVANAGYVDTNGNSCCALPGLTTVGQTGQCAILQPNYNCTGTYTYTDSNGYTRTISVNWIALSVQSSFPTTTCGIPTACDFDNYGAGLAPMAVISQITLANNLSYTFSYVDPTTGQTNPYGEIMQITLPTGGYIKYKWATLAQRDLGPVEPPGFMAAGFQIYLDARVITERHVSADGVNENVWTYSYAGSPGLYAQSTTVTDPLGNQEVHTFGGAGADARPTESSVVYYQGSSTPLKQVQTNWATDNGPVTINQPQLDPTTGLYPWWMDSTNRNPRVASTTTTLLDTNQVTQTQTDFNDCFTYNIFPVGTQLSNYPNTTSFTECRPIPTETREYDYGSGTAGVLLRKTDYTYLHQTNNTYLNAHMWTLETSKTVKDGLGNVVAQTNTTYDSTSITSTGGAALVHDYTNYGSSSTLPRGNPTVISRLLTSNSSWLTTTNTYNDLGQLVSTTDPGGHTYSLSYTDNFVDGTNRNSFLSLTSVVSPTAANGVPHVEGKQYYWNTGLTAAVCGQNYPTPAHCAFGAGLPASDYAQYTYDMLGRPATVTHGDGGTTSFTFSDLTSTSTPITVSSSSAIDTSNTLLNAAVIDGLGRVKQTQLNSDPDGADFVDTTFDALSRKSTVSNPHRNAGSSTDGITTYVYDALGRTTMVIPPDGTSSSNNVTTAYSGNTVTVTDQAGKQRKSYTDGLGRLIEVDEPGAPPTGSNVTASNGYLVVAGSVQIGGGSPATGTFSISGQEDSAQGDPPCLQYDDQGDCIRYGQPPMIYDTGVVQVTVNGRAESVYYGQGSTPTNIASALVTAFNNDSSAVVTASILPGSTVVTLTAKTHGVSTDYSISATSWTTDNTGNFTWPSFNASTSGGALTGGVNDTTDTGTISVSVGGASVSVNYSGSSTPSSLATAVASAINGDSSMTVTASASSNTVNLTEKTQGAATSLAVSSSTNYPSIFKQPSFSVAPFSTVLNVSNAAAPMSLLTPAVTLYSYDTLDDLTCVEQHGNVSGTGCSSSPSNDASSPWRVRRFTYDSLGRLLTAKNPESGTISYTYDSDGNLLTKTDARSIVTTMTYDQLHRVLTKTYSDGTPSASYTYDVSSQDGQSPTNPIGRLAEVTNSNARTVNSYDVRGRVVSQWQCTPVNCGSSWYSLTYQYNYHDEMKQETTPMGFTVNQSYDPAARLLNLTSSWSDATHPAALMSVDPSVGYAPTGAIAKFTYGNGLIELNAYNSRLQPTGMATYNPANNNAYILNLSYGFYDSAGHNNGNVMSFTSTATQLFMRSYTYDELNRLATMSSPSDASGCDGLSWTYDAWANRSAQTTTSGSCLSPSHSSSAANRIIDSGFNYDAAGNMTQGPDPNTSAADYYTFDAENRMTAVSGGASGAYSYDASGNRVRKVANGVTTDYVYDASGAVIAEWSGGVWTKGYVYSGAGQLVAQYNGALGATGAATVFVHKDHLGSTRILSTYSTTANQNAQVSDNMDYLPYGEQIAGDTGTTHKFTGKERDAESGLDLMGARYLGSSIGRFTTADPLYLEMGRLANPQALNLYAYVLNNPLNLTDPTGLDEKLQCHQGDDKCTKKTLNNLKNDLNKRKGAKFKVKLDANGMLRIQGKVDPSKLKGSEEALYHAITDQEHHGTLDVVGKDPTIDFDRFDGGGQNTVDASDMALAAKADQSVAGHILAHAIMESYVSAEGEVPQDPDNPGHELYSGAKSNGTLNPLIGAHDYASNFFGGGIGAGTHQNGDGTSTQSVKVPALGLTLGLTFNGDHNMTGVTVKKGSQ